MTVRMSGGGSRFDVVVVGGRCAGAALAALLARRGVEVALVEQARFPRDTRSSHIFQADALSFLDQLGLTERLRAAGAPFVDRTDTRVGDVRIAADWPRRPGEPGGLMSVRRFVLDPILADAAAAAGADVRMGTKLVGQSSTAREWPRSARALWSGPTGATRPSRGSSMRASTT